MSLIAKVSYLLCSCHKFSESVFAKFIKQYEKNKTVATRHFFTLFINMKEPKNKPDQFNIDNVKFKFEFDSNNISTKTLQKHNMDILTFNEIKTVRDNINNMGINLLDYDLIAILQIAALIKIYKNNGFKYIFIPVVINYGRYSHLLHQTVLIIDCRGMFIYYEPYGVYTKYNKSYKQCICELFMSMNVMFDKPVKSVSYHDLFNNGKEGIQNIILKINNERDYLFAHEYDTLFNKITNRYPLIMLNKYGKLNTPDDERSDKTEQIMDMMSKVDETEVNKDLHEETLKLYQQYNSKTCVTITLVEMDLFFDTISKYGYDNSRISQVIGDLYKTFHISIPNTILFNKLIELITKLKIYNYVFNVCNDTTYVFKACEIFKKDFSKGF